MCGNNCVEPKLANTGGNGNLVFVNARLPFSTLRPRTHLSLQKGLGDFGSPLYSSVTSSGNNGNCGNFEQLYCDETIMISKGIARSPVVLAYRDTRYALTTIVTNFDKLRYMVLIDAIKWRLPLKNGFTKSNLFYFAEYFDFENIFAGTEIACCLQIKFRNIDLKQVWLCLNITCFAQKEEVILRLY